MSKESIQGPNPAFDAYIAKAQPFAQPILAHLRKVVHKACKDVVESIKWGFPNFDYNGKILCSMAAFKQHCAFGFWLANEMQTMEPYRNPAEADKSNGMGHFGKITSIKELPPEKELIKMIREAMELTDKGVVVKRATPSPAQLEVPDYLAKALSKNKAAKAVFEKFPPSHRKEYIQWITEAKTEETRQKRLATALEWIAEGKGRNWRYEKKAPSRPSQKGTE